jgi:hypothetical protein
MSKSSWARTEPTRRAAPTASSRQEEAVSFPYLQCDIRERTDPKAGGGGGGRKIRPRKSARQSANAPDCPEALPGPSPRIARFPRPSRGTAGSSEPNLPPTPAVESDRVWKAPDHHPSALRTFPHPLEIPPPTTTRDFHSYSQPRRRGTDLDEQPPARGPGPFTVQPTRSRRGTTSRPPAPRSAAPANRTPTASSPHLHSGRPPPHPGGRVGAPKSTALPPPTRPVLRSSSAPTQSTPTPKAADLHRPPASPNRRPGRAPTRTLREAPPPRAPGPSVATAPPPPHPRSAVPSP